MSDLMRNKPGAGILQVVSVLLAVLTAGTAQAVPQIMTAYGDQMPWLQADVNAMGGSGTALYRGALSNVFNPAFLVREEASRLDAGLSLDQEHEDRFQPLYDSFDSWVTDVAIASNREHYWQAGFGLARRLSGGEHPLVAAVSLADRYPFQYRFWEELRNPSPFFGEVERDQIIALREREVEGTLRDLSLGVGYGVDRIVSVGASVHYAFGTRKDMSRIRDYVEPDNSYVQTEEFEMDGVNVTIGLQGTINDRLEVGVAWESQLEVDGDRSVTLYEAGLDTMTGTRSEAFVRYPNRYRAGLTFRPRTDPRTVFTVEIEFAQWSELADSRIPGYDNPQNLKDSKDVRIGLEHTFYNDVPLRFGFRHLDSYADEESTVSVFSAGVGMPYRGGMVSASVELSKVAATLPHQFPYPDDYFGENYQADPFARVEDTRFRVGVGYNLTF